MLAKLPKTTRFDLAWATFSPIDCWRVAHKFAQRRRIPFVGDIKDHLDEETIDKLESRIEICSKVHTLGKDNPLMEAPGTFI